MRLPNTVFFSKMNATTIRTIMTTTARRMDVPGMLRLPSTPKESGRLDYDIPIEGLQAALTFLPTDHPIVPHIRAAIDRGIDFLVRAQVKEGPYVGGLPQAISRLPDDGSSEVRAFNAQATEIRIDYVQHSLSALLQYLQRGH